MKTNNPHNAAVFSAGMGTPRRGCACRPARAWIALLAAFLLGTAGVRGDFWDDFFGEFNDPPAGQATTEKSICAKVAMEVEQNATLERQAFDAYLRLNNGYTAIRIEDVDVDVWFRDDQGHSVVGTSDANDTNATFFIRVSDMQNINDVNGNGLVAAQTTAEVHWLIVPSLGAGGMDPKGKMYEVGGTLRYKIGGEENAMELLPDRIYVKPMPELAIDYFIQEQVFGDDAFTEAVEPSVPFPFGMRIRNTGHGEAKSVKILSAQPQIKDNAQKLLIGFEILDNEVNGKLLADKTLRYDFGTIAPQKAAVAVATMQCSLSGEFTEMSAQFSHADELGGRLTSLLTEINTHLILQAVLVDLKGRDRIRDFLARDGEEIRLYESENIDQAVSNFSASAKLDLMQTNGDDRVYRFSVPGTVSPLYAKVAFSNAPQWDIASVRRLSDGSMLPADNAWFSQWRLDGLQPWEFSFNLFDAFGGGTYEVTFHRKPIPLNLPPTLQFIGRKGVLEGNQVGFLVEANDPNGTIPVITAQPLPPGATFVNDGNGGAVFHWWTHVGDYGVYPIRFTASDGELSTWRIGRVYVGHAGEQLTADGLPKSLENWDVDIKRIDALTASGVATVLWDSVDGMLYELFASDNPVGANMVWSKVGATLEAQGSVEDAADSSLGTNRSARFYRLVLAGEAPDTNRVWGVIRRPLSAASYTMVSPPLRVGRRFDGELGKILADQLIGDDGGMGDGVGDEVYILQPGGAWRVLYLDAQKTWRESNGQPSTYELEPGRGFFIARQSSQPATVTFTGSVGNDGTQTNRVLAGWNMIGLSEGRSLDIKAAFQDANPIGAASEDGSDMLIFQNPNGSWRRLMLVKGWGAPYDGNWFDLSTFQISTNRFEPGVAVYYFRQPSGGSMDVRY